MINDVNDEVILVARLFLATLFLIFGWRKLRDYSGAKLRCAGEHRVVVRRRFRDRLDHIPVLDHLAVFQPVDVHYGFAARTVRQAVPLAVEDDVVAVREDASDLAVPRPDDWRGARRRTFGALPSRPQ